MLRPETTLRTRNRGCGVWFCLKHKTELAVVKTLASNLFFAQAGLELRWTLWLYNLA